MKLKLPGKARAIIRRYLRDRGVGEDDPDHDHLVKVIGISILALADRIKTEFGITREEAATEVARLLHMGYIELDGNDEKIGLRVISVENPR